MKMISWVVAFEGILGCSGTEQHSREEIEQVLHELHAAASPPSPTGDPVKDAFLRQSWASEWYAYTHYAPHDPSNSKLLNRLPGEDKLEAFGSRAAGPISRFLAGQDRPPLLTARLLALLGRLGEPSALATLESFLNAQQPDPIRRAAIRGLGLLGDPQGATAVLQAIAKGTVPIQDALWALVKLGHAGAVDNYLGILRSRIDPYLMIESKSRVQITRPKTNDSDQPPRIYEDLMNLVEIGDSRAVSLLIDCLRHQDHSVQHIAEDLILGVLHEPADVANKKNDESRCKSLLQGSSYREWKAWMEENERFLKWNNDCKQWFLLRPAKQ